MNYPYQKVFLQFLTENQGLAKLTVKTYDITLTNFFNYLMANRPAFAHQPKLANLTEGDVRAYLNMLQNEEGITLSTYNKILSQMNRYFRYLFTHQLITTYPTLTLHGKAVAPNQQVTTKWLYNLPAILADENVHFYTRLTLLLTKHGYTVNEFLQPGFYRIYRQLPLANEAEQQFTQAFAGYHKPLQELQNSPDLFLKQRYQPDNPRLSNAALHKYLRQDEQYLGIRLAPQYLHQSYILAQLREHRDLGDAELANRLKLDPASLLYYKRLLLNAN